MSIFPPTGERRGYERINVIFKSCVWRDQNHWENGKVLFCGSDIARALGYSNTRDALNRNCKGVVKRDTPTSSGIQEMSFIPKGDIYRLAAKSELPGADAFERWIFDEVLPSIHEHGAYMTPATIEQMIATPEFGIKLLEALKT